MQLYERYRRFYAAMMLCDLIHEEPLWKVVAKSVAVVHCGTPLPLATPRESSSENVSCLSSRGVFGVLTPCRACPCCILTFCVSVLGVA